MATAVQGFPAFMKSPANRISQSNRATPRVEGYVFDGSDGSQMAFWTCSENAMSAQHVHDYDEYMVVVEGCYTLIINGERIPLNAGKEYFIERGLALSRRV
jgi:quercetin dioxygenase-like cupin family protein